MEKAKLAPTVGIGACFFVLAALATPYALVGDAGAVTTYYGAGSLNALFVGFFAVVSLVVLAAGREGRSDPALAAGAALTLGLFAAVVALAWATTVPESLVVGLSKATLIQHHRWVVVVATVALPVSSVWYARALGVV